MPDIEDPDEPDETDWAPPPPPPDTWAKWEPRSAQVFVLHALVIGAVAALRLVGVVSQKTANVLLACEAPALGCAWGGLIAFLIVRARERSEGRLERGRTLVLGFDLFTVVFAVMGAGFWLAILAI
ncbi:MAG: hypothetical protein J0I06_20245 [Planctomycetes bacterium]|nr:hypothetical protein [Planctomycetota bacterium]